MTLLPECLLYTKDEELARRIEVSLREHVTTRRTSDAHLLEILARQADPCVLLLDLRSRDWQELLGKMRRDLPDTLVIALAATRSEPALEVAAFDPYAVEDIAADPARVRTLVLCAREHLRLVRENRILKERRDSLLAAPGPQERPRHLQVVNTALQHLSRALRFFTDVNALLDSIVDTVSSCTSIPRVGLFALARDAAIYRLRAQRRCLETTIEMEVSEDSPFVRWLWANAHLIARSKLPNFENPEERMLLESALNA
ncbi:MAG: hypothetical protein ACUVWX_14505, partial [Kiritimatiellia bacterium]